MNKYKGGPADGAFAREQCRGLLAIADMQRSVPKLCRSALLFSHDSFLAITRVLANGFPLKSEASSVHPNFE